MSKGGNSKPPPAPNPQQVIGQQTAANIDAANASRYGDLIDQYGPGHSTTYNQVGTYTDPTTGREIPRYAQTTTLSPFGQMIFDGRQGLAASLLPQAFQAAHTPFDFSGKNWDIISGGPNVLSDRVADAMFAKSKSFLDPQWEQGEQSLEAKLSRQGIPVGSEAYNNATRAYNNARTQAYDAAANSAIAGGTGAAGNIFQMALLGQNQNINQQQLAQNRPLQTMNTLIGA